MLNSLSAGLNRSIEHLLAIFHNIISPQQLAHRLGWRNYGDTGVDGCCDRPKYVATRLRLLLNIEVP